MSPSRFQALVSVLWPQRRGEDNFVESSDGVVAGLAGGIPLRARVCRSPGQCGAVREGVPQGGRFSAVDGRKDLLTAWRAGKRRAIPEIFTWFPVQTVMLDAVEISWRAATTVNHWRALVTNGALILMNQPKAFSPISQEIGEIIQRLNREEKLAVLLVEQKLPLRVATLAPCGDGEGNYGGVRDVPAQR
jgi:hypothetical protein